MTTVALNNLWTYIEGLSLKRKDREWLASKLLEPKADDAKTAKQKAYVKETKNRQAEGIRERNLDSRTQRGKSRQAR